VGSGQVFSTFFGLCFFLKCHLSIFYLLEIKLLYFFYRIFAFSSNFCFVII